MSGREGQSRAIFGVTLGIRRSQFGAVGMVPEAALRDIHSVTVVYFSPEARNRFATAVEGLTGDRGLCWLPSESPGLAHSWAAGPRRRTDRPLALGAPRGEWPEWFDGAGDGR